MAGYSHFDQIPPWELEEVSCGVCGAANSDILFRIRGFPIRLCRACGIRYVSPRLRPASLLTLYSESGYFKSGNSLVHGYMDYASDRDNILATLAKRFQWIMQQSGQKASGRMLDIGCAMGFSLEYGMDHGWDVYGLEPSPYASQAASGRLKDRIANTNFDSCPYDTHSFDLILLWDVLEHLPNSLATMRRIFDFLRPGGILSIITPDSGSLLARMAGRWWMEYAKPTEHIYFFTRKSLKALAQKTGFATVNAATAGKFVSLRFLIERFSTYLPLSSTFRQRVISSSLLSKPLYIDIGDKMHFLFQKQKS